MRGEVVLERGDAGLGHLDLGPQGQHRAVDLGGHLAVQVVELGAQRLHARMVLAVGAAQVGLAAPQRHLLAPQLDEQRRGHHVGHRFQAALPRLHVLDQPQARLLLGEAGAGLDELAAQIVALALAKLLRAAVDDVMRRAVALDRLLGGLQLGAQHLEALLQPGRGAAGRDPLGLELALHVEPRGGIGDARRLVGIARADPDADDVGASALLDLEAGGDPARDLIEVLARRLGPGGGPLLGDAARDQPVLRQPAEQLPPGLARPGAGMPPAGRVELRVAGEIECCRHPLDMAARADHVDLGLERARLHRQPAHDLVGGDDPGLRGADHERRLGGIARRALQADQHGEPGADHQHRQDQPPAAAQHARQLQHLDADAAGRDRRAPGLSHRHLTPS